MLQLAMVRHEHTRENTIYVGDRPEDEAAAVVLGYGSNGEEIG
jgi:hypothetical protein